jgi:phosphoglycerate dehydrogenase-like enzyme
MAAPNVMWIHTMMAGIDHLLFPELVQNPNIHMTNAKGVYSSTLAEYVMGMILYFAKDVKRLNQQKEKKVWEKFNMTEIAGKTMGIVGYGDIGVACAKLAKSFRMQVVALRRHPNLSSDDPLIDRVSSHQIWPQLAYMSVTHRFTRQDNSWTWSRRRITW